MNEKKKDRTGSDNDDVIHLRLHETVKTEMKRERGGVQRRTADGDQKKRKKVEPKPKRNNRYRISWLYGTQRNECETVPRNASQRIV